MVFKILELYVINTYGLYQIANSIMRFIIADH